MRRLRVSTRGATRVGPGHSRPLHELLNPRCSPPYRRVFARACGIRVYISPVRVPFAGPPIIPECSLEGLTRDYFGALLLPLASNSKLLPPRLPRSSTATPQARSPYPLEHYAHWRHLSCRDKCARVRSHFAPRFTRLRSSWESAATRAGGDIRHPPLFPMCAGQSHLLYGPLRRYAYPLPI